MSKSSKEKEAQERDDPHRQILPLAPGEAYDLFLWLETIFDLTPKDTEVGKVKTQLDTMPERLVLTPVYGKDGRETGVNLKSKEWRPKSSPPPNKEQLVELANLFVQTAERHCTNVEHKQKYTVFAYSNLKGPKAFSFHMFTCFPGPRQYTKETEAAHASDDADTHADRTYREGLAHIRWKEEQLTEAISGALKLQQDIIKQGMEERRQLMEHLRLQETERRQWIVAVEQAETKKMEREILLGWAQLKQTAVKDGIETIKGYLGPVIAYATKGKVGIVEGLKQLLDDLKPDQRVILLGAWDTSVDPPTLEASGILDADQVMALLAIVSRRVPASKAKDLVMSFTPDQFAKIQSATLPSGEPLLSPRQVQAFLALGKVASEMPEAGA